MIDTKQKLTAENCVKILLTHNERRSGSTISKPVYDMTRFIDIMRTTFDMTRPVYLFVDRFMNAGGTGAPAFSSIIWEEMPVNPNYLCTNATLARQIVIYAGNSTTTNNVVLAPQSNVLTAIELDPVSLVSSYTWSFRFVSAIAFTDMTDGMAGTSFLLGLTFFQKPADSNSRA